MNVGRTFPVAMMVLTLLIGCTRSHSAVEYHDLGRYAPGQPIAYTMEVDNPFDEPALVTGLSDACSVRVENRSNGIAAPHEQIALKLLAQASRMPGPAFFKLEVAFEAGLKKSSTFHSFRYDVPATPMLSRAQVWIGTDSSDLYVLGVAQGDRVGVLSPPGIASKVEDKRIIFSGHDKGASQPSRATIIITPASGPECKLSVDIFQPENPACRFFPSVLWSHGEARTCALIGIQGPGEFEVTPTGSVSLKRIGTQLTVTPSRGHEGEATVQWKARNQASAKLAIWVQR